ncbi:hypothetical protein ACVWXN_005904 [Bradyrhizobium sp. i1.4.4]
MPMKGRRIFARAYLPEAPGRVAYQKKWATIIAGLA